MLEMRTSSTAFMMGTLFQQLPGGLLVTNCGLAARPNKVSKIRQIRQSGDRANPCALPLHLAIPELAHSNWITMKMQ